MPITCAHHDTKQASNVMSQSLLLLLPNSSTESDKESGVSEPSSSSSSVTTSILDCLRAPRASTHVFIMTSCALF